MRECAEFIVELCEDEERKAELQVELIAKEKQRSTRQHQQQK
jgi:hypothetical protein